MVKRQSEKEARLGITHAEAGTLNQRGSGVRQRMGDAKVFARNLRLLTAIRGLKATTAAKAIQAMLEELAVKHGGRKTKEGLAVLKANPVDPAWYRRMMSKGVTKSSKSTYLHMHALAQFFGKSYEDLWDRNLPEKMRIQKSKSDPYATATKHLHDLLASGRHDYLRDLLASLHRELEGQS